MQPTAVVTLFVLIQFHTSADCNLHGFSPQRRAVRAPQYYHSYPPFKKYSEKTPQFSRNGDVLTREIRIKQGRLKGVVREFRNKELKNVETFLGIPYAAPPVKSLRFMPPGSPPSWKEVKVFDSFAPVCPQTPPDLANEPFKTMNAGFFNRVKGLTPFLNNQSEDCLYLNIYAPTQDGKKHPVVVYIHGESFEWNSGNPYDGSVLASYGSVVVVTINFRLGILGFLRPGLSEHTVSNFGLLDQIAALQWIKDNIEEFGGDPSLVTLMGHGTGAACINFLMVSPVSMASQGLFHKAILMSGTALADWALTHNPLQFTIQVAEALNCPLVDANEELSNCLRRKRLSEIMSVKITVPEFQTPFGPIVDGSVVPNTPQQVMGVYQNLFTRYDLLYGITEWESYHLLDPVSLTYGMLEGERNEFLRKFMYSRYEALPYFALATTLSEYLDWRKAIPPAKSAAEEHRDLVLDLLSDARFAAPVIQMALFHSKINPKSYLYVFKHKSKMGEFAGSERSISGEEIAYVFGIPLLNEEGPLSHHKFSISEQLLSESIISYFTNFAKTGNPNAPRRLEYLSQSLREWQQHDVYWPEYDSVNQSYLALGVPPRVGHHYRSQMTQYWNEILPDLLKHPTKLKPHKPEMTFGEAKNTTYQKPSKIPNGGSTPWTYGIIRTSPKEYQREKIHFGGEEEKENPSSKQMDRPLEDTGTNAADQNGKSAMVPYFVAVSACLLLINVIVIGLYCYKRKTSTLNDNSDARSTKDEVKRKASCGESVYSIVECSERSKTEGEEKPKKLQKYINNTAENHVKVKKWIQQEIFNKCSRKNSDVSLHPTKPITKSNSLSESSSRATPLPKPILKNSQRIYQSSEDLKIVHRKSVQKVSVGIDATPSSRGESVLKQTPIELTKSLDRGTLRLGGSEEEENLKSSRRSRTSVSLQMIPTNGDVKFVTSGEPEVIKLCRAKHEPTGTNLQTFLPSKNSQDINVTSRDSDVPLVAEGCTDPLENFQRRNFPKVLPDFPDSKALLRLSFPQPSFHEFNRNKQNPPPPPPPRVSTLQRKIKRDQDSHSENVENPQDDDSSETDSSKTSVIKKPSGKSEKAEKRREPSIVIQPKIGPKKQTKQDSNKKAHINLQTDGEPPRVLDSKGPSDKVKAKSFRI